MYIHIYIYMLFGFKVLSRVRAWPWLSGALTRLQRVQRGESPTYIGTTCLTLIVTDEKTTTPQPQLEPV